MLIGRKPLQSFSNVICCKNGYLTCRPALRLSCIRNHSWRYYTTISDSCNLAHLMLVLSQQLTVKIHGNVFQDGICYGICWIYFNFSNRGGSTSKGGDVNFQQNGSNNAC